MNPTIYRIGVGAEQIAVWIEESEVRTDAWDLCRAWYGGSVIQRTRFVSFLFAEKALQEFEETLITRGYREVPRGEPIADSARPTLGACSSERFAHLEFE